MFNLTFTSPFWASLIAQLVKNPPAMQETPVRFRESSGRVAYPFSSGSSGRSFPIYHSSISGFPGGSAGKESTCNAGDLGSIPGVGRSPEKGKGCLLQYCGLENSTNCVVHGVAKSRTRLSTFT